MSKTNYKRLGDYIREVDVRNRDLKVTKLLGVSISKEFMPSIANTIGTDMSSYKVVEPWQFAYGPVTSRNGDKVSIALYKDDEKAIVSQAYTIFEVTNKLELLPEYLMMWFRRPEFDRYARFKSHGSAREIFSWEEMCDVELPIPPIDQQQKIVAEYNAIQQRIKLNEQLIVKLEETAQAIYRKMFVDGIDKNNLPEGWRMGTLEEIAEVNSGKTCKNKSVQQTETYLWPIAGASGIIGYSQIYNQDMSFITIGRVGTLGVVNRYNGKVFCADNVLIIKSQYYEYCYQILRSIDYNEIVKGGVQSLITQTDLKGMDVLIPNEYTLSLFEQQSSHIFHQCKLKKTGNLYLHKLQSLLLVKMGKSKQ